MSRLNAMTHGLTAETVVIRGEDPDKFDGLRRQVIDECAPETALAFQLCDRLAGLLWRLRRIPVLEAALLECHEQEDVRKHKIFQETKDRYKNIRYPFGPHGRPYYGGLEEQEKQEKQEEQEEQEQQEELIRTPLVSLGRAFGQGGQSLAALGKLSQNERGLVRMFDTTLNQLEKERARVARSKEDGVETIELKPV